MYSNISQILLLYKTWQYCNKFDSPKSLGVCYWCVKIPQCGYVEHGLKHISFYVQKHIVTLAVCYNAGLVLDKLLGTPASVKLVYSDKILLVQGCENTAQIARFVWPTWGPPGSWQPQVGPTLAPWILLSGSVILLQPSQIGPKCFP